MTLGIGYNYVAPNFREIHFEVDALREEDRACGRTVKVPTKHTISWQGHYQALYKRTDLSASEMKRISASAPTGIENMFIIRTKQ